MGKGRQIFAHMLEHSTISPEAVPGQPIIEIAGDCRVLIENHQGVAAYGRESIQINVTFGAVCVCGCHLEMMQMTKEKLVICGRIDSVQLQRRR